MKRVVSLIIALTLALQSSGLAVSAGIGQGQSATNPLTLDEASRITSRYEGPTIGGVTTTFGYDDIGQLTSESSTGYSASYAYDANGNRTNRTVNGLSETYTVDDADKLTSVTWSSGGNNYSKNYSYHYSGRVTGITYKTNGVTTSSETLGWNKENRLISRGSDTFTYNGLNTRTAKTDGGGSFTYKRAGAEQTSPILYDGSANFLPGVSEKRSGTTTFLHSGIKNGLLQTNSTQTNTATNRYDAFGKVLSATGTWNGPFGYGGKFGYQTDDVDMQPLGDRYYDPSIGRFLSRDAAKDGRNWYAYCKSSPIINTDPSGNCEICIGAPSAENLAIATEALTGVAITVGAVIYYIASDAKWNSIGHSGMHIAPIEISVPMDAHRKGARPSTRNQHEEGDSYDKRRHDPTSKNKLPNRKQKRQKQRTGKGQEKGVPRSDRDDCFKGPKRPIWFDPIESENEE